MHSPSLVERLIARKAELRAESNRLRCELRRNAAALRPAVRNLELGRDLLRHSHRGLVLFQTMSRFWKR
jgi:hypothetical protein